MKNGFIKVSLVSPHVEVGSPSLNKDIILNIINKLDSDVALFPELAVTSYSCADLFLNSDLIKENNEAILNIVNNSTYKGLLIVGGLFYDKASSLLYNAAYVIKNKKILGIIPKNYLANYAEFDEKRYFIDGRHLASDRVSFEGMDIPFGKILFNASNAEYPLTLGIEICEDLWAPIAPSCYMSVNGANVLLNLSASSDYIKKEVIRRNMVHDASRRLRCAYLYASSNASESTSPFISSGALIGAINGEALAYDDEPTLDTKIQEVFIDLGYLDNIRRKDTTFKDFSLEHKENYKIIDFSLDKSTYKIEVEKHPFQFKDEEYSKVERVLSLQSLALEKRLRHISSKRIVLGVSGGLDSTLALLTAYKTAKSLGYNPKDYILPVFLPYTNSSEKTKSNAKRLTDALGLEPLIIPINAEVDSILKNIDNKDKDVTYENCQVRVRTTYLMELANKYNGIMLGTSDLSEIAMGYSTYNGDHMSMFNANSSISKTMMQSMIRLISKNTSNKALSEVLLDIVNTPISAELNVNQLTENEIGKYEYIDFILYRFIKMGNSKERIHTLLMENFNLSNDESTKVLNTFYSRFYKSQFKRNASPDSVKVTEVSLDASSDYKLRSDVKR